MILKAVSLYNLGYSLKEVSEKISKESRMIPLNKKKINASTISSWINKHKRLITFHKFRKEAQKLYSPEEIIFKNPLQHKQVYLFKYHKAKLDIIPKLNDRIPKEKIEELKSYLKGIPTDKFPHHFFKEFIRKNDERYDQKEQRGSKLKFETLPFIKLKKNNYANKLAELALASTKNNNQRHQVIQDFMLANDTSTLAIEVPVYLTKEDINYLIGKGFNLYLKNEKTPITGHIDILQVRNNMIHILDYKPDAIKINPINQLVIYALALSSRLKIPVKQFKTAWFDEKNYFEFFPLQSVYVGDKR